MRKVVKVFVNTAARKINKTGNQILEVCEIPTNPNTITRRRSCYSFKLQKMYPANYQSFQGKNKEGFTESLITVVAIAVTFIQIAGKFNFRSFLQRLQTDHNKHCWQNSQPTIDNIREGENPDSNREGIVSAVRYFCHYYHGGCIADDVSVHCPRDAPPSVLSTYRKQRTIYKRNASNDGT